MAKDSNDTSWMNAFLNPSKASYSAYQRSQMGQYNPIIRALTGQLSASKGKSPMMKMYEQLIGAMPTNEAVSAGYGTAMSNLANYMKDIDVSRAGRGVTEAIQSIAAGINADAGSAQDVATAAGAVSGVGGAGGDLFSKAMLGGAQARLSGLEAQRLGDIAQQRQTLSLGLGEAQQGQRDYRNQLMLQLAEAAGKKRGAMPNPLDTGTSMMTFLTNLMKYNKLGKYSGGSGTTTTPDETTGDIDGIRAALLSPGVQRIGNTLSNLVTPSSKPRAPYVNPIVDQFFNNR